MEERKGLKIIRDNPNITIKKADKGSAVVTMNTTDYLREGYRQLQDEQFYQKITGDITNKISNRFNRFETKALSNWPLQSLIWLRFIDDIFMIWTHGEDNLKEFITYLKGIHPTIKFTHESSPTQIDFLDTTVKINDSREIYTTL